MNKSEVSGRNPNADNPSQASSETSVTTDAPASARPLAFTGALRPLGWLDRAVAIFEAVVLTAGILIMAVNSVANVIGRFVFGQSLYFSEELNQFLVILVTFAGIGFAARHGRHIRMSAIYDELPDKARKTLMIVIALITGAAMFVLAWYSLLYVLSVYNTGRIAPVTRIPVFLTLIWLPIGFVITGIQYVLTAVANLTRPDVYLSVSVIDSYEDTETQL
ncbi:TRAP transporter small permease [Jiella marina]|uniref:TRAP transporter small permease n=1 Tax=Jiella sp. LLJ827 TaxID=2917712 RepID=UPI00210187A6|nr:TRAP transporter small permease [Jiella sp. LLJ827]MCQ0987579.1 TRAP transporter small permease [Jiella sp. LLJ827]